MNLLDSYSLMEYSLINRKLHYSIQGIITTLITFSISLIFWFILNKERYFNKSRYEIHYNEEISNEDFFLNINNDTEITENLNFNFSLILSSNESIDFSKYFFNETNITSKSIIDESANLIGENKNDFIKIHDNYKFEKDNSNNLSFFDSINFLESNQLYSMIHYNNNLNYSSHNLNYLKNKIEFKKLYSIKNENFSNIYSVLSMENSKFYKEYDSQEYYDSMNDKIDKIFSFDITIFLTPTIFYEDNNFVIPNSKLKTVSFKHKLINVDFNTKPDDKKDSKVNSNIGISSNKILIKTTLMIEDTFFKHSYVEFPIKIHWYLLELCWIWVFFHSIIKQNLYHVLSLNIHIKILNMFSNFSDSVNSHSSNVENNIHSNFRVENKAFRNR